MLRGSKPRLGRLGPANRLATLASVFFSGLLVSGLGGPARGQQALAQAPQPAPNLVGNWQADSVSMLLSGGRHKTLTRQDGMVTTVISAKTFTLRLNEDVLSQMDYVLDATKTPWTIDMKSKEGGMLGICSLTGDDLEMSLNDEAKGRPENFDRDTNGMVLALRRHRAVELVVINADGTGLHQVAEVPEFTRLGSPRWSHDGSKIAFDGWRKVFGTGLNETHVFTVIADGSGLKDLGPGCMPTWSPDDKQLTYCQYTDGNGVWVMNADGSHRRQIDGNGWGSRWSPVRNEIAYTKGAGFCIYDLDTGKSRMLPISKYSHVWYGFAWSPDGKWLSFLGDLPGGSREFAAV